MASNSTPPSLLEFSRAGGRSSPRCLGLPAPRVPRGARHSAWQSGPRPPHPCGTPPFTQGPLTCPQPGPWGRSPWSAFLALSPCRLGRDFLLENSRILPGGPTLGLGTQEEGKSGPAGLVAPRSFPPRVRCIRPAVFQLRWSLGLCSWGGLGPVGPDENETETLGTLGLFPVQDEGRAPQTDSQGAQCQLSFISNVLGLTLTSGSSLPGRPTLQMHRHGLS